MTESVNHCGTCTMCCKVYAVRQIEKVAGEWCKHCSIGKGCKIYAERPEPCVVFECLWLQSQKRPTPLAPELRPDRCKVVFAPTTNERIMSALIPSERNFNWERPEVLKVVSWLNHAGIAVAVGTPGSRNQLLLQPDGSRKLVRLSEPDEDGMQWSE